MQKEKINREITRRQDSNYLIIKRHWAKSKASGHKLIKLTGRGNLTSVAQNIKTLQLKILCKHSCLEKPYRVTEREGKLEISRQ